MTSEFRELVSAPNAIAAHRDESLVSIASEPARNSQTDNAGADDQKLYPVNHANLPKLILKRRPTPGERTRYSF